MAPTREQALSVARIIGCRGVHQEGEAWMPCATHDELSRISQRADKPAKTTKAKTAVCGCDAALVKARAKRRAQQRWEHLRERPVVGLDSIPGMGIVAVGVKALAKMVRSHNRDRRVQNAPAWSYASLSAAKTAAERGGQGLVEVYLAALMVADSSDPAVADLLSVLHPQHKSAGPRFNRFPVDGDYDGLVQDGTPFQRRARTLGHRSLRRTVGSMSALREARLRDMAAPMLVEDAPPHRNTAPTSVVRKPRKAHL